MLETSVFHLRDKRASSFEPPLAGPRRTAGEAISLTPSDGGTRVHLGVRNHFADLVRPRVVVRVIPPE